MSGWLYASEATVGVSVHDGELAVTFCDSGAAQWSEPAGPRSDWADKGQLAEMIADAIRDNADYLAESIVSSLVEREGRADV